MKHQYSRIVPASLIMLMLILFFIQPSYAAGLQETTSVGDQASTDSTRVIKTLVLNLPTVDQRQAAEHSGSGPKGAMQVPGSMSIEKAHPPGFNWKGLLTQSALFLGIEQGWRLALQPGTREALKGPFFDDWFQSVLATHGWGDGDNFMTNYIGHPMEGGVTGNIFLQNYPRARKTTFGKSRLYWTSRLKGMAYTALYSTQFELGPVSEASIGNVGHMGTSQAGWVDLVTTPLAGFGWQVGEDILDLYFISKVETWTENPFVKMFFRTVFNPTRTFAQVLAFKVPWHRETRPGVFRRSRQYYDPPPANGSNNSSPVRTK